MKMIWSDEESDDTTAISNQIEINVPKSPTTFSVLENVHFGASYARIIVNRKCK